MSESDELTKAEKALADIFKAADDAMGEPGMPGKALISFRWIKKLAERGLGKSED
jgi:hypothetical protein